MKAVNAGEPGEKWLVSPPSSRLANSARGTYATYLTFVLRVEAGLFWMASAPQQGHIIDNKHDVKFAIAVFTYTAVISVHSLHGDLLLRAAQIATKPLHTGAASRSETRAVYNISTLQRKSNQ